MGYPTPTPGEVKALRVAHGMTREQFAEVVKSSPRAVSYWESETGRGHPMPAGLWELALLKLGAEGSPPPDAPA